MLSNEFRESVYIQILFARELFSLLLIIPGGYRVEATPVPISNTAVKLHIADGTAGYPWESRSLPGFFLNLYIFLFLESSLR